MSLKEYMHAKHGDLKEISVDENEFIDILKRYGIKQDLIETTVKFCKINGSQVKLENYLIRVL